MSSVPEPDFLQPLGGALTALKLGVASILADGGFRGVEANQAHQLVADAHGVGIDHLNLIALDRFGRGRASEGEGHTCGGYPK